VSSQTAHGGIENLWTGPADRVPKGIAKFGIGQWDVKYGNGRAVVRVDGDFDVVVAYLPWRRRDAHPESKNVLVVDSRTNQEIANSIVLTCNREYGEVAFQPGAAGVYYLYYLQPMEDDNAYRWPRDAFPITRYVPPRQTADPAWLARHRLRFEDIRTLPVRLSPSGDAVLPAHWRSLPHAELLEFQSLGEWNSFFPMEVIATLDERLAMEDRCRYRPFILFPETRRNPIRMTESLPYCWAIRQAADLDRFSDSAMRNEYFVFQVGLYAFRGPLLNVKASWTALQSPEGATIPPESITCFNIEGVDQRGNAFTKTVHVEAGRVQALWFGVDIPESAAPGLYLGAVTISCDGLPPQTVTIELRLDEAVLPDRGDGDHWRLSRLRWLNSRIAVDEDVCAPFVPVKVEGPAVSIELGPEGLVAQVTSFIDMFDVVDKGRDVLAAPVRLAIRHGGKDLPLAPKSMTCSRANPGAAHFEGFARSGEITMRTATTVEMDGCVSQKVTLESAENLELDTIRLEIPIHQDVARYVMGAGADKPLASACPSQAQGPIERFEQSWVGDYNVGLALRLPKGQGGWFNGGAGTFRHERSGGAHKIILETGPVTLPAGKTLELEFELYATPFKPLPKEHWGWRYHHASYATDLDVESGIAAGATVFTLHHGCRNHPYISYPFPVADGLREISQAVHRAGGRFKVYYTIRELSTRAPELWALRSLGTEVLEPSVARLGFEELSQLPLEYQFRDPHNHPLTGQPWMCEHLVSDYHTRWHSVIENDRSFQDASLQISGASRWANFYLEGLRWLMENIGLDGLYLDGITFDRLAFQRVRKTLVRGRPQGLIDYHSSPEALPQLPYFDSLWFGEGADYSREAAYWLVAVSGIAFGVPGEMLLTEASVHRGMVYGISHRHAWMRDRVDPSGLWKWWDEFGIDRARMLGYWMKDCPVRTGHPDVLATAYVHRGRQTAIAVASWVPQAVQVKLDLDWETLGLDPRRVEVTVPAIPMFQDRLPDASLESLPVEPGKGWIVVVKDRR